MLLHGTQQLVLVGHTAKDAMYAINFNGMLIRS